MKNTFLARCARLICLVLVFLLGFEPVVWAAPTITYFHNDIAGSPVAATDESGTVVWRESYRPYGERVKNEAAAVNNRQFYHGKPLDTETGLSYFGARYYDPVVGRFMGIDPVGFDEANIHSFNRYAYGNNNPLKYRDPDGREPITLTTYAAYLVLAVAVAWEVQAYPKQVESVKFGYAKIRSWMANESGSDSAVNGSGSDRGKKTVDQLVGESTEGRETKGRSDQYIHDGGREQRDKDFDSLGATGVKDRGRGTKTGTLPDGRPVNVHDSKTDGVPTIQIGDGRREIKIRYPEG